MSGSLDSTHPTTLASLLSVLKERVTCLLQGKYLYVLCLVFSILCICSVLSVGSGKERSSLKVITMFLSSSLLELNLDPSVVASSVLLIVALAGPSPSIFVMTSPLQGSLSQKLKDLDPLKLLSIRQSLQQQTGPGLILVSLRKET